MLKNVLFSPSEPSKVQVNTLNSPTDFCVISCSVDHLVASVKM